ncbi:hypothetical protein Pd630_LPD09187 (plasmid) [Rhodococcus opacus PD630]|nr:hypothetical protein Pd630_LPD09187 [Rhodococcus opacus PD630]
MIVARDELGHLVIEVEFEGDDLASKIAGQGAFAGASVRRRYVFALVLLRDASQVRFLRRRATS